MQASIEFDTMCVNKNIIRIYSMMIHFVYSHHEKQDKFILRGVNCYKNQSAPGTP